MPVKAGQLCHGGSWLIGNREQILFSCVGTSDPIRGQHDGPLMYSTAPERPRTAGRSDGASDCGGFAGRTGPLPDPQGQRGPVGFIPLLESCGLLADDEKSSADGPLLRIFIAFKRFYAVSGRSANQGAVCAGQDFL